MTLLLISGDGSPPSKTAPIRLPAWRPSSTPFAGHATNSVNFYRILWISEGTGQQNRQLKIEDGRSKIAIFNPPFSILHFLIAGAANQWTNTDDAKKQLVDGNLVRRSHLAKRTREQQIE